MYPQGYIRLFKEVHFTLAIEENHMYMPLISKYLYVYQ